MNIKKVLCFVVAPLMATLVLTGCIKSSIDTKVEENGSGTLEISVEFSEEILYGLYQLSAAVDPQLTREEFLGDFYKDWTTELLGVDPEGWSNTETELIKNTVFLKADFDNYSRLEKLFSSGEGPLFETFEIKQDGDNWKLSGRFAPLESFGENVSLFSDPSQELELKISFQFPGEVSKSNATTVSGGKATWKIGTSFSGDLEAEWKPGGTLQPAFLVLGVILLAVLSVMVFVVIPAKKKKSEQDDGLQNSLEDN